VRDDFGQEILNDFVSARNVENHEVRHGAVFPQHLRERLGFDRCPYLVTLGAKERSEPRTRFFVEIA